MKIIHVADVHLGAEPDIGFDWSKKRKADIHTAFQNIIVKCRDEKVDLLLIAGDLFHRPPLMREIKEVDYLFKSIPDTVVVLIAGNHDYLKTDGYYDQFRWSENVYGLWDKSCVQVEIPPLDLAVYGCSYHQKEVREPLYDGVRPRGNCKFHILVGHGGDSKHIPFDRRKLAAAGFDYVALGHIHKPEILSGNLMAYAGALEPLNLGDVGVHGYMEVTLSKEGCKATFVPAAVCEYQRLEIQVHEDMTQYALEQLVRERLQENGSQNIYHLHLWGIRDRGLEFNLLRLMKLGNVVKARDVTHPYYDLEELEETYGGSLIGAYIERLKDREGVEKKALYYGLEALLEAKR